MGCSGSRNFKIRSVSGVGAGLVTVSAQAQCFRDLGRKKASEVGVGPQLAILQAQMRKKKCKIYGLRYRAVGKNGSVSPGMLVFNTGTGEVIRAKYTKGRLRPESWAGVTKTALLNDNSANGIDQKHYIKPSGGTSMVVANSTARFMRANKMGNFLRRGYMTVGAREPEPEPEEEQVAEAEASENADPSAAGDAEASSETTTAAASTESGAQPSGDPQTVAALPADDGESEAQKRARHDACLKRLGTIDSAPSKEAKAAVSTCEEELQIAEGRQETRRAKESRFNDLVAMHVTGNLTGCLAKISKLGRAPSATAKESEEACDKELKARLARAGDEKIYAVLDGWD